MIAFGVSNKINVQSNNCENFVLKYRNVTDAFGFDYETDEEFYQQVRLSGFISDPKHDVNERIYRQTNGVRRRGNVVIDKFKHLHFDQSDEALMDASVVAIKHSEVLIDDVEYFSDGIIEWEENEFNNLNSGKVKMYDQAFNQTSIRC